MDFCLVISYLSFTADLCAGLATKGPGGVRLDPRWFWWNWLQVAKKRKHVARTLAISLPFRISSQHLPLCFKYFQSTCSLLRWKSPSQSEVQKYLFAEHFAKIKGVGASRSQFKELNVLQSLQFSRKKDHNAKLLRFGQISLLGEKEPQSRLLQATVIVACFCIFSAFLLWKVYNLVGSLYCDHAMQLYFPVRHWVAELCRWNLKQTSAWLMPIFWSQGKREPYSLASFARSLADGFSRSASYYRISWPASWTACWILCEGCPEPNSVSEKKEQKTMLLCVPTNLV